MRLSSPALFAGLLSLLVFSCNHIDHSSDRKNGFGDAPKNRLDSLKKEVLDDHDLVMPKMEKLSRYLQRVRASLDSLSKLPAGKIDTAYQSKLKSLEQELDYGQTAMDTWMEEFKLDSAENDEKLRTAYFESEKIKISKVKDAVLSSLARADSIFIKK